MGMILQSRAAIPIFWNMITIAPDAVGQGSWSRLVNASAFYNALFSNGAGADGDNYTINFRCPAGTYTFRINAWKDAWSGIVDIDIDGVEIDSYDLYAAVSDYDNIEETTGLSLGRGEHALRFRVDGRNGSSNGWNFIHQAMNLQRTA